VTSTGLSNSTAASRGGLGNIEAFRSPLDVNILPTGSPSTSGAFL
jgi:hypothetical protein